MRLVFLPASPRLPCQAPGNWIVDRTGLMREKSIGCVGSGNQLG